MDPVLIGTLTLRGLATLFTLQARPEIATAINAVLAAHQAGRNVDAYMQSIADALDGDLDLAPWDDITRRINAEVDEFLSRGPGGQPE